MTNSTKKIHPKKYHTTAPKPTRTARAAVMAAIRRTSTRTDRERFLRNVVSVLEPLLSTPFDCLPPALRPLSKSADDLSSSRWIWKKIIRYASAIFKVTKHVDEKSVQNYRQISLQIVVYLVAYRTRYLLI